jgi:DNA-binding LytR/AlgR family response regulator
MLLINDYIRKNYKSEEVDFLQFSSSKELVAWINEFGQTLDILILDICLDNNQNGIVLAKNIAIKNPNIKIIFVTAYLEQVIDISEAPFIYFVYKNKTFERKLCDAIDRALQKYKTDKNKYIVIKDQKIFTDKVECFIADKKQTRVLYNDNAEENLKIGISLIAELIPNNFVSIHRSCIVNMDYIDRIEKSEKLIKTISGNNLQIARSKYNNVLKTYRSYLKIRIHN